jgi:hypothetical protein
VANRPRVYCPKCTEPARRIYYQDAADAKTPKNQPIDGWAYCPTDRLCFKAKESNP